MLFSPYRSRAGGTIRIDTQELHLARDHTRPARMSDVAKLAGVGTMTVSRVLNGNKSVSPVMRERVLRAVAELKYVPNEVARSLREQRARQIGVIVPNIRDAFFARCADAIGAVARAHDYSLVISTAEEDPEIESREAARLLSRRVGGLIIVPAKGRSLLNTPDFAKVPIVTFDRPPSNNLFDCVIVQNREGAYQGTCHLIAHHHRRIVHLTLTSRLYTMKTRIDGYRAAMLEHGLKPEVEVVNGTPAEMIERLRPLLSERNPPTAFFCGNNVVSYTTMHALSALGRRIPQDVALAGFDDFETADILKPALTVVRQPFAELGKTAAELLFKRIEGRDGDVAPGKQVILPVQLIVRSSCGCEPEAFASSPGR